MSNIEICKLYRLNQSRSKGKSPEFNELKRTEKPKPTMAEFFGCCAVAREIYEAYK
jgi:hypothetical protein